MKVIEFCVVVLKGLGERKGYGYVRWKCSKSLQCKGCTFSDTLEGGWGIEPWPIKVNIHNFILCGCQWVGMPALGSRLSTYWPNKIVNEWLSISGTLEAIGLALSCKAGSGSEESRHNQTRGNADQARIIQLTIF